MPALPLLAALAFSVTPAVSSAVAQLTITVLPASRGVAAPANVIPGDLMLSERDNRVPVLRVERLPANQSDLQLFVVLDDSTRSSSLGLQLPELKHWINTLPSGAQVAVGYIRNGAVSVDQPFTVDHAKASALLRLPYAVPGQNGSPYFALSEAARHWPSKEASARRTLLLFTDGVDRYYGDEPMVDDPYVDAAVDDALKNGIAVYSVYLRGAGRYGAGFWGTTMAQSRLLQVGEQTGGYSYQEDFTDPISVAPFLTDFNARLANQYRVTFQALSQSGFQPVKLKAELPGVKISAPSRVYVP